MNTFNNSFSSNIVVNQKSSNRINTIINEVLEENKYVVELLKKENLNLRTMPRNQIQFLYSNLQPFLFQRNKISQCVERLEKIIQLTQTKKNYLLSKLDIIIQKEKESMQEIIKLVKTNGDGLQVKKSSHQSSSSKKSQKDDSNKSSMKFIDINYVTNEIMQQSFRELPLKPEINKPNTPNSVKSNISTHNQSKKSHSNSSKSKLFYNNKINQQSHKLCAQKQIERDNLVCRYRSNSVEVLKNDSRSNFVLSPSLSMDQDHSKNSVTLPNTSSSTKQISINSKKHHVLNEYWQGIISKSSQPNDSKSSSIHQSTSKTNEFTQKSKSNHRRSESANVHKKSELYPITKPSSSENLLGNTKHNDAPVVVNQIPEYQETKVRLLPEKIDDPNDNADLIQKIITKFDSVKQFIDKHKRLKNNPITNPSNVKSNIPLNSNLKHNELTNQMIENLDQNHIHIKKEHEHTVPIKMTYNNGDGVMKSLSNQRHLKEQDILEWLHTNLEHQKKNNVQPKHPTKPHLWRSKSRDDIQANKGNNALVIDENNCSNVSVVNSLNNINNKIFSNYSICNQLSVDNYNMSSNSNLRNIIGDKNSTCPYQQQNTEMMHRSNDCHEYIMA